MGKEGTRRGEKGEEEEGHENEPHSCCYPSPPSICQALLDLIGSCLPRRNTIKKK